MNVDKNETPAVLAEGRYFRFLRKGSWEYIEPAGFTGVVLILPITDDGKVVLIEQHRPPRDAVVVEIPAGLVGDEGMHDAGPGSEALSSPESLVDAARRELLEETGYEADAMELLTVGAPSAGSNTVIVHVFKATGLRKVAAGGGNPHEGEAITVIEVPLGEVDVYLDRRRAEGALIDLKVYTGLYFVK